MGQDGAVETVLEVLGEIWRRASQSSPAAEGPQVWIPPAVALLCVLWRPAWRVARHGVTIAHEAGHALAAVLTGRRLRGVHLHSDTSGLTVSRGRPRGPGMVLTAAAGYPAPAVLGLGAAALVGDGHAVGLVWLLVVGLAVLTVLIRNAFGLLVVLIALGGLVVVAWQAETTTAELLGRSVGWFLLLAAPRAVLELGSLRRRGRARSSDADVLAGITPLPGGVWVGIFLVATLGAVVLGVWWLVTPAGM